MGTCNDISQILGNQNPSKYPHAVAENTKRLPHISLQRFSIKSEADGKNNKARLKGKFGGDKHFKQ